MGRVSGLESASREELLALVAAQAVTIEELTARVVDLERRLGQNSRNSSRPPSSDSFDSKPSPRSVRKKTGRRPGKQPGSPGAALGQVDDPDEVIDHVPVECSGCGADLADADSTAVVRRQVHDIPEVTTRVVEHRLHKRRCARPGCGTVTTAAAPAGVTAPAVYGPNLRALAVYLLVYQIGRAHV